MKLTNYIADHTWLLVFYTVLMTFISLVIYVAPFGGATVDMLLYTNVVAFLLFCLYFFGGYMRRQGYFRAL
ncbi:hypothetical protein DFP93_1059 [Aneurinibacillus soli]|uniref:Uncharacterized protein n=1 Tax=Aneurinibacillus soli TaxID=1500254 RepID=A0A0U5B2D3_9BACL|nr:hypothetical protein [Aneurinibacillus soli]PYE62058.1 hypothetical protein DFP93_1059 [Aneurinibacillus soli]BAU28754.1 hypothetical protein CB4_02929 [Aneurinibacillus soli]